MSTIIETSTLGAVAARQSVINDRLAELLDAHGPETECTVTRGVYPFGTYLLGVEVSA